MIPAAYGLLANETRKLEAGDRSARQRIRLLALHFAQFTTPEERIKAEVRTIPATIYSPPETLALDCMRIIAQVKQEVRRGN